MKRDTDLTDGALDEQCPTRRRFLQVVGGTLAGACLLKSDPEESLAAQILRPGDPLAQIPRPPLLGALPNQRVALLPKALPPIDSKRTGPVSYGPLLMLDRPRYDPSQAPAEPQLPPVRVLSAWKDQESDWYGAGQIRAKDPSVSNTELGWLRTTPVPSERCVVSTVWNKGRDPSYCTIIRVFCMYLYFESVTVFREAARVELGYASLGGVTPGGYVEVRYPFATLLAGLRSLDDLLMQRDPDNRIGGTGEPRTGWGFHTLLSAAFDPTADQVDLRPPLIWTGSAPFERHVAGRWWHAQYSGRTRERLLP